MEVYPLDLEANSALISRPSRGKYSRITQETIELGDIPPIIKSANGNIFWADEQCTRRTGLTTTEARLFFRLLQLDEPENIIYDDFKAMFDDFGREQMMLQKLVKQLPWWHLETHQQKRIWEARIDWLERMKEPRLWLCYLMARRRRILKKATVRVLARFKEKSQVRSKPSGTGSSVSTIRFNPTLSPLMKETSLISEAKTGEETQMSPQILAGQMALDDTRQVTEELLPAQVDGSVPAKLAAAVRDFRDSLGLGHRENHTLIRFPIIGKGFEATRKDIKRQVELLMPQPKPYIVIGWFRRSASDPKERILDFDMPEHLFHSMRHGERAVRGWRWIISLKSLKGFGLYKCDISRGAHTPLMLTTSQKTILCQFYLAYEASYRHSDDTVARAWQGWVQDNLNDGKDNPLEGRYSLQLMYDWSSYRLALIVVIPLLLSIGIGFWYQTVGDVVTAWTLALYIVTAAAALIALLAIIGSLKDM